MPKPKTLVISGSIAIDRIMSFPGKYSELINKNKLDSISVSIFLEDMKNAYGGVGGNIAYSLALLGDSPILVGSVGPDGLIYMEHLAKQGVNIQHIYESEIPTATFNVISDGDQNQIGGFYPGAMFDSDAISLDSWKGEDIIAVISPQDPKAMRRQVKQCQDFNLALFYDVSQQVTNVSGEDMKSGVEAAELLILNEYELSVLSDKTGLSLEEIKTKVPVVITTLGKDGSIIEGSNTDKPISVGVIKPKSVKDPTGAGDSYRSGFLYGYSRAWPLEICAKLGAAVAAYSVETNGPQDHFFTPKEVEKRFIESFGDNILPESLSND